MRLPKDKEPFRTPSPTHFFFHAGYDKQTHSSCGVAIGMHVRRYQPQYITRVTMATGKIQGRGLMIRYRRGRQDVALFSLYYPTRGKGKGAIAIQKALSAELTSWFNEQMNRLPSRCLPIVGTDLNSTCAEDSTFPYISGPCEADHDGINYGIIKPVLKVHGLVLANTYFNAGITYYGIDHNVRKRIDYIIVPAAVLDNINECMVSWRKGKRLQHIRCVAPKDHYPLTLDFQHSYESIHQRPRHKQPNRESCNAMLLYGHRREEFVGSVEEALEKHMDTFGQWEFEGNVDMINAGIMQILNNVATKMLTEAPGYTEDKGSTFNMSEQVGKLLEERRRAKEEE
eukprot:4237373-Pyramimonas_sp.AAC.1